jgi:hypothetical protein
MKRHLIALAAAGLLAACGQTTTQSPIATVSAAEAALAASGRAALAYMQLPPCGGSATICSNAMVKAKIKTAYDTAYSAVTAAQTTADAGGTPDMTAATAALTTLQTLVTGLPTAN